MKKYILSCVDHTVVIVETSVVIDSLYVASVFAGKQVYDITLMQVCSLSQKRAVGLSWRLDFSGVEPPACLLYDLHNFLGKSLCNLYIVFFL